MLNNDNTTMIHRILYQWRSWTRGHHGLGQPATLTWLAAALHSAGRVHCVPKQSELQAGREHNELSGPSMPPSRPTTGGRSNNRESKGQGLGVVESRSAALPPTLGILAPTKPLTNGPLWMPMRSCTGSLLCGMSTCRAAGTHSRSATHTTHVAQPVTPPAHSPSYQPHTVHLTSRTQSILPAAHSPSYQPHTVHHTSHKQSIIPAAHSPSYQPHTVHHTSRTQSIIPAAHSPSYQPHTVHHTSRTQSIIPAAHSPSYQPHTRQTRVARRGMAVQGVPAPFCSPAASLWQRRGYGRHAA